jgi:hypothetical protein
MLSNIIGSISSARCPLVERNISNSDAVFPPWFPLICYQQASAGDLAKTLTPRNLDMGGAF